MNGKRPDQLRYAPPSGRRKNSIATPSPPYPNPPGVSPYISSSSATRVTVDSPSSSYITPVARFEPSASPPLRSTDAMRSGARLATRRDLYDAGMHHSRDTVRPEHLQFRDPIGHRPTDGFYRPDNIVFESPRLGSSSAVRTPPTHRNRSYDVPSPMMAQPVRILRNHERERERELRELAADSPRAFISRHDIPQMQRAYAKGAAPGKAQHLGEKIHSLAPLTTLQERCQKFISTLHPDRPDLPALDEPYEYPYTEPCDPPPPAPKFVRRATLTDERPGYMAAKVRIPSPIDFGIPIKVQQQQQQPDRRRRHRHRPKPGDWDSASSGEDCARRMYRLRT